MAIKHKKYIHTSSGENVRAIKVTERNFKEVADWSGAIAFSKENVTGDVSNQRVRVKGLMAQVGDFVVRVQKGTDDKNKPVWHFFRVKHFNFFNEFKAV